MTTDLERQFHDAMIKACLISKQECRYNPIRLLELIQEQGALAAAKSLLYAPRVSEGYIKLWEKKRLDLTVEALVLKQEWQELFSEQERQAARKRLKDYGYQV